MKFQVDIDQKKVKIVEGGKLDELVKALKKLLGDDYDKYHLEVDYYVYWYPYVTYTYKWQPMTDNYYLTWDTDTVATTVTSGIYNAVFENDWKIY